MGHIRGPVLTYEHFHELCAKMFLEMLLFMLVQKAEKNMNSREGLLGFLGK
jgi:hypothetical protein